jgi:hypothetical protein
VLRRNIQSELCIAARPRQRRGGTARSASIPIIGEMRKWANRVSDEI